MKSNIFVVVVVVSKGSCSMASSPNPTAGVVELGFQRLTEAVLQSLVTVFFAAVSMPRGRAALVMAGGHKHESTSKKYILVLAVVAVAQSHGSLVAPAELGACCL